MPPRKVAPKLQVISARQFSCQIIQVLLRIEREVLKLKKINPLPAAAVDNLENGVSVHAEKIAVLQQYYVQLVQYLESIPGVLMEQINTALLIEYSDVYHSIDQGWRVWVLTKGVEARAVAELVTPTYETHELQTNTKDNVTTDLPILSSVISTMATPNLTVLDFKHLSHLSTVSDNVFSGFNTILSSILTKVPKLRSLTLCSPHSSNSLPQCSNTHLQLLGQHCPGLVFLDVSFNKNVTSEGIRYLTPNPEKDHPGCVNLEKLFIFDCGVFEKELAKVILHFPHLTHLGYKETGKVLKTLFKTTDSDQLRTLKLTHVDNLGSKTRRLIASAMRCKKPVTEAMFNLCPDVENVKLRVSDDDVSHLSQLTKLSTVELVYHVGNIGSPGPHTQAFLSVRGSHLSSIAIICNTMSLGILTTIAEQCPGLTQLWSRSNHLMAPYDEDISRRPHSHLLHLKTLYFRVGEGELSVSSFPEYILPYLLKNARDLRELIIAVRSNMISDHYVQNLVTQCQLTRLEKILFVVPGLNSLPGILKLTANTVHALLHLCPELRKLGNILSWSVTLEDVLELETIVMDMNYDLEIVNRKMTMR